MTERIEQVAQESAERSDQPESGRRCPLCSEPALAQGLTTTDERSIEIWARTALLMLGRVAADRGQWEHAARVHGASRRNLPAWMWHPRWWDAEPRIREALGDAEYEAIATGAESEDLDQH